MRVPILSACCAALLLAALPAAAHGWSSRDDDDRWVVERNCPIVQPPHPMAHRHLAYGVRHHGRAGGGCPIARAAPAHYEYERVFTPNGRDWSHEDQGSWRQDRRAWSDGDWSGRMADRGRPGCHDANGPGAYRDRDGGHRATEDYGMRCHDDGMRHDQGWMASRGVYGYSRETEEQWSSSERHGGWRDARDGWSEAPSMTDRYGFLTWPGKTHYMHGEPMGDAQDIGPRAPPEDSWRVHP